MSELTPEQKQKALRLAEEIAHRNDTPAQRLATIRRFVAEQADDVVLFDGPMGIGEAYVSQELQRLHRVIETGVYEVPSHLD